MPAALHPETVPITYVEADGTEKQVDAELGMNLMEVAHANNVDLEGTKRKHILKNSMFAWRSLQLEAVIAEMERQLILFAMR